MQVTVTRRSDGHDWETCES